MDGNVINITPNPKKPMSKRAVRGIIIACIAVLLLIVLVSSSFYVVGQAEQAVVSQFGVIKEIVVSPDNRFIEDNPELMNAPGASIENVLVSYSKGLHFRVPFITKVEKYNSRLFTYISDTNPVNSNDKKQYFITIYGRWQIANPALFAITQYSQQNANQYLDTLIFPLVVQKVNEMQGVDFINNKDLLNEQLADCVEKLNQSVKASGIRVADIQIHRSSLPPANLESTYARMIADRAKVAQQLRAEGMEAHDNAVSTADREARVIEAEAIREAEQTRGEGDAQAMKIYADAYGKDADFYTYWRSLRALESSVGEGDVLVLDKNHPLWRDLLRWIEPE